MYDEYRKLLDSMERMTHAMNHNMKGHTLNVIAEELAKHGYEINDNLIENPPKTNKVKDWTVEEKAKLEMEVLRLNSYADYVFKTTDDSLMDVEEWTRKIWRHLPEDDNKNTQGE